MPMGSRSLDAIYTPFAPIEGGTTVREKTRRVDAAKRDDDSTDVYARADSLNDSASERL